MNQILSPDELDQLFSYNAETGSVLWRVRDVRHFLECRRPDIEAKRWNSRYAGQEAGTISHEGYRVIRIFGNDCPAHRIAYAMHYRCISSQKVDHIDGNRLNNSAANLRQVTNSQNARNAKLRSDNRSGHVGVSFHTRTGKWRAYINGQKGPKHIGVFGSISDAVAARKKAQNDEGYHANHGR